MLAFLATFLGLVLAYQGYGLVVLSIGIAAAASMATQANVSPIFFQPSTDLLDSPSPHVTNDPLGFYQGYETPKPFQMTRSYY